MKCTGAMFYLVEADFEQAMGITLQRGRFVTSQDNENAPLVIDIDDVFARTYFPDENPDREARPSACNSTCKRKSSGWWGTSSNGGRAETPNRPIEAQFLLSVHAASRTADAARGGRRGGGGAHGGRSGNRDGTGSPRGCSNSIRAR